MSKMDEKINLANSPQLGRIEKMVQELCPDGVKWVKVKDFADLRAGKAIKAEELSSVLDEEHPYPCFGGNGIRGYIAKKSHNGSYSIIGRQGALCGCVNWATGEFYATEHAVVCTPKTNVSSRYLFYLFEEGNLNQYKSQGAQPGLAVYNLNELEFPLPPLPIQEAIADILDKFDRLSAELQENLQAELQARKQQYEYYRDQLLAPSNSPQRGESDWKEYTLGELFVFKNGLNASKEQFGHGTPIVNYVNVYKKYSISFSDLDGKVELDAASIDRFRVQKGDVFFTRTSETREEVGIASDLLEDIKDCVFSGFVLRARPISDKILPEYCKYCFSTFDVRKQIIASSTLTTRALTNGTVLSKVKIPLPPLSEQARIVAILDKFEALVNDLSQGLPAEIAAVKEQYEYYRNKLLIF